MIVAHLWLNSRLYSSWYDPDTQNRSSEGNAQQGKGESVRIGRTDKEMPQRVKYSVRVEHSTARP